MKYIFVFIFLLFATASYACKCADQQELSLDLCRDFDFIAKVRIDSVSTCNGQSIAHVLMLELFKGVPVETILFDCSSSCQMNIEKGETWLFYARMGEQEKIRVSLCDRNRKFFTNDADDFYKDVNGMNFTAEIDFLKSNIGLKQIAGEQKMKDITQRENELGTGQHKIWLVVASVAFFLLFYFLFKKYFK